jgi:hypothetical protein
MKIESASYEDVRDHIRDMVDADEKFTVRNVRMRAGGKSSTIGEYVKRWHLEQGIKISEEDFSTDLKKAIIIDRNLIIHRATESYKLQIEKLQDVIKEQQELMVEHEAAYENLSYELTTAKSQATIENTKLVVQVANLEKSTTELKERLQSTQEKLELVTQEKNTAVKDAAVWESKYNELKQQPKVST